MATRSFYVFISPGEWVEALQEVCDEIPLYGVFHYWPKHAYEEFSLSEVLRFARVQNACEVVLRDTPLEPTRPLKDYVDAPPKHGMILLDFPNVFRGRRLVCIGCLSRVREDEPMDPDLDPTHLQNRLRRAMMRRAKRQTMNTDGQKRLMPRYTPGALELYDQGLDLAFDSLVGSLAIPEERWETRSVERPLTFQGPVIDKFEYGRTQS